MNIKADVQNDNGSSLGTSQMSSQRQSSFKPNFENRSSSQKNDVILTESGNQQLIPKKAAGDDGDKKKSKLKWIAICSGILVAIAVIVVIAILASGSSSPGPKPPGPPTPPGPSGPTYDKVSATTLKEILKMDPTWTKFNQLDGSGSGQQWLINQWSSDNYGHAVTEPVNTLEEGHVSIENGLMLKLNGTLQASNLKYGYFKMENIPISQNGSQMVDIDFQIYNVSAEVFQQLQAQNKTCENCTNKNGGPPEPPQGILLWPDLKKHVNGYARIVKFIAMGRNPDTGNHDPTITDLNEVVTIKEGTFTGGELSDYGRVMYKQYIGEDKRVDWMCKAGFFNQTNNFLGKGIIWKNDRVYHKGLFDGTSDMPVDFTYNIVDFNENQLPATPGLQDTKETIVDTIKGKLTTLLEVAAQPVTKCRQVWTKYKKGVSPHSPFKCIMKKDDDSWATVTIDNQSFCTSEPGVFQDEYGNLPASVAKYQQYSTKAKRFYTCCGKGNVITWKKYDNGDLVVDHVGPFGKATMRNSYSDCVDSAKDYDPSA